VVIENPLTNEFIRVNNSAWQLIGRLDGRMTVDQAWQACRQRWQHQAPTQNETIQLLGQLYQNNLLHSGQVANTEVTLYLKKQRQHKQIESQLQNFFFAKIPLIDPDTFFERWQIIPRILLHPFGLMGLASLALTAFFLLVTTDYSLFAPQQTVLSPSNMIWIGVLFWCTKLIHECGHGLLCKYLGHRETGNGGEVHSMGVMLMVMTPLPYVDTTSSSAIDNKWYRILVGAGGMLVEFIIALCCLILWCLSPADSTLHLMCYNLLLITSVTTVLFNANPLMRFDGYYYGIRKEVYNNGIT
jgi:putative peptide zinc metalloprotease protein